MLYREAVPNELISAATLVQARFAVEEARESRPFGWHAEHYCRNTGCQVREVVIHAKSDPDDPLNLGELKCPSCSEPLAFHHHLTTTLLVPADSKAEVVEFDDGTRQATPEEFAAEWNDDDDEDELSLLNEAVVQESEPAAVDKIAGYTRERDAVALEQTLKQLEDWKLDTPEERDLLERIIAQKRRSIPG